MADVLAEFRRTTTFGCLHGDADGPCDFCYSVGLERAYVACRAELAEAVRDYRSEYSRAAAAERERDEFKAICDEMNALSGEELHLAVDVIARMRVAERSLATLRRALTEITETCGRVCSNYDTCAHGACMGSHRAWEIATAALSEAARGETPDVQMPR